MFKGLDNDFIQPQREFGFSLKRILSRYCLEWSFMRGGKYVVSGIFFQSFCIQKPVVPSKFVGRTSKKAGNLRSMSVRRHPLKALASGAK